MTRLMRQAQRIEVRRGQVRGDDAPEQFLWRGRLYVVRAVLARWTESGSWWRTAAVRGLATGEGAPASIDDREREWWRVEADSGRLAALSAGPGVYDLCFDWSEGTWSLARVLD
jgi:hypothetical protein